MSVQPDEHRSLAAYRQCSFPIRTNLHAIWCLNNPKTLSGLLRQIEFHSGKLGKQNSQVQILLELRALILQLSAVVGYDPYSDKE